MRTVKTVKGLPELYLSEEKERCSIDECQSMNSAPCCICFAVIISCPKQTDKPL